MNITFYKMTDNVNKIDKTLNEQTKLTDTIYLKHEVDEKRPVLLLTYNPLKSDYNYCYIDFFDRYYFIESVENVRYGLYRITLNVDVLKTYATTIKTYTLEIIESENPNSNKIDCEMSENTSELVFNLNDVFDHNGKLYLSTVFSDMGV